MKRIGIVLGGLLVPWAVNGATQAQLDKINQQDSQSAYQHALIDYQLKQRQPQAVSTRAGQGNHFIKLDAKGKVLFQSTASGACVFDAKSGLFWEVKTQDKGPRDYRKEYRWDQWQALVKAANREALCGYRDWRVPTRAELKTLSSYYSQGKSVYWSSESSRTGKVFLDPAYFPSMDKLKRSFYWSSSPYADSSGYAWGVDFSYGYDHYYNRNGNNHARLVRGGQ